MTKYSKNGSPIPLQLNKENHKLLFSLYYFPSEEVKTQRLRKHSL